jgi:hypothetical protein
VSDPELVEKLAKLVAWLDACPGNNGLQYRTLEIEIGVSSEERASVRLRASWVCAPGSDDAPMGSRAYYAEGETVRDALGALHVPRVTRPGSRRRRPRASPE